MKESARKIDNLLARIFKIIGKILKFTFYAIIIGINGILIFRMLSAGDPRVMETLMVNDRTAALWEASDGEMEVLTQKQYLLSEDGRFAQSNLRWMPDINQLQITVRYNNSTVEGLVEDFLMPETQFEGEEVVIPDPPNDDEDLFDITLVKVIKTSESDQSPDEESLNDNALDEEEAEVYRQEVRYTYSASLSAEKLVYNYRRLIFDDIDLSDAAELYLEFYYRDAVDYAAAPYTELLIWRAGDDRPYELTKHDIKALEQGAVNND
ncbi:MAG: hypothetical protein IJF49_06710 [Clostridia bacterium]|nr:hypothetical protein [Clostridia bacterium]